MFLGICNDNINVESTPSTEVMSESVVNESVQVNDQSSVSSDDVNLEDDCRLSSMTCKEAFLAQNLNDDGSPWTQPSEEDIVHCTLYTWLWSHCVWSSSREFGGVYLIWCACTLEL